MKSPRKMGRIVKAFFMFISVILCSCQEDLKNYFANPLGS